MDFGKLPSIAHVNFTLPPDDPPGNAAVFEKLRTGLVIPEGNLPHPSLYIGATGWSVKEWVGKIYPKGTKSQDYLRHYTRQFNTIELNTTHYRIPDALTIQHWYNEAAPDFCFCPKVLQTISHAGDLGTNNPQSRKGSSTLLQQFCEAMAGLQEKLGCCFIQLPPHFGPDRLPVLEAFLKNWNACSAQITHHPSPITIPLAVEVRHENWFNNTLHFNRLFELLEKYEASPVITDVAGRRDVLHGRLTSPALLIRFVGNNLHPTDFTRLDAWTERLREWFGKGLQSVYFFTHEPDNLLAPELAMYLAEKMSKISALTTRGPVFLQENPSGEQMSLF